MNGSDMPRNGTERKVDDRMIGLGRRVASLRVLHGMEQIDLGREVGLSQATISTIENGQMHPGLRALMALADYFGASLDYLVYGTGTQPQRRMDRVEAATV